MEQLAGGDQDIYHADLTAFHQAVKELTSEELKQPIGSMIFTGEPEGLTFTFIRDRWNFIEEGSDEEEEVFKNRDLLSVFIMSFDTENATEIEHEYPDKASKFYRRRSSIVFDFHQVVDILKTFEEKGISLLNRWSYVLIDHFLQDRTDFEPIDKPDQGGSRMAGVNQYTVHPEALPRLLVFEELFGGNYNFWKLVLLELMPYWIQVGGLLDGDIKLVWKAVMLNLIRLAPFVSWIEILKHFRSPVLYSDDYWGIDPTDPEPNFDEYNNTWEFINKMAKCSKVYNDLVKTVRKTVNMRRLTTASDISEYVWDHTSWKRKRGNQDNDDKPSGEPSAKKKRNTDAILRDVFGSDSDCE